MMMANLKCNRQEMVILALGHTYDDPVVVAVV